MFRLRIFSFGNLALFIMFLVILLAPQSARAARFALGVGPPPPPDTRAAAGTTVNFSGLITNIVTNDAFAISQENGVTLTAENLQWEFFDYDESILRPFDTLDPELAIRPGENSGLTSLYSVAISPFAVAGTYSLSARLIVLGVDDLTSNDVTVNIIATPEPTSMLLIGTGLAGIAATVRRRRQRNKA